MVAQTVTSTTTRARYAAPPLPRIAALYPRVSDPKQDEDDATSLRTQEAGERAWALANGYAVVEEHIYREKHSGEEYYERPGWPGCAPTRRPTSLPWWWCTVSSGSPAMPSTSASSWRS